VEVLDVAKGAGIFSD